VGSCWCGYERSPSSASTSWGAIRLGTAHERRGSTQTTVSAGAAPRHITESQWHQPPPPLHNVHHTEVARRAFSATRNGAPLALATAIQKNGTSPLTSCFFFGVPALGVCSSPQEGLKSRGARGQWVQNYVQSPSCDLQLHTREVWRQDSVRWPTDFLFLNCAAQSVGSPKRKQFQNGSAAACTQPLSPLCGLGSTL
jgi:hypothetical protein